MKNMIRAVLILFLVAMVAACGGGESSTVAVVAQSKSLAAGDVFKITANTSVLVPSGTTVSSPNGSVVSINGTNNIIYTQSGAVVNVPANATGPANNLVTTGPSAANGITQSAINVTALAGSATTSGVPVDGTGTSAIFWGGGKLAIDADGNVVMSDRLGLRKVTQAGVVTTLEMGQTIQWQGVTIDASGNIFGAGGSETFASTSPVLWGASLAELSTSGTQKSLFVNWDTSLDNPSVGWGGLAVDGKGILFLADSVNNRIVKFNPALGTWSVLAGSGSIGNADGVGTAATFTIDALCDMPIDSEGNLYLNTGSSIRKISPNGTVSTLFDGFYSNSSALALDSSGNFYVTDSGVIYRISQGGSMTSFPFANTSDLVTAMVADKNGNLYVGTRGVGAQIFKISF